MGKSNVRGMREAASLRELFHQGRPEWLLLLQELKEFNQSTVSRSYEGVIEGMVTPNKGGMKGVAC